MAEVTPQKNDQLVRRGLGKATKGGRLRSLCCEHGDELVTRALRDGGLRAVTHGTGASLRHSWPCGASRELPKPYCQKGFEAAALRVAATPSFTASLQLQQRQRAGAASRREQAFQNAGEEAHNDAMRAAEARRTAQREREAFELLLAERRDERYFGSVEGADEDTAGEGDDMSSEGSERADVEGGDTESGAEVKNADPAIASLARLVLQPSQSVQSPSALTVLAPPVAANILAPPEAPSEDDAAAARPPGADGVELRRLASDNARLRAEGEQLLQEAQAQAEEAAQLRTQLLEQEEARKELQQRHAAKLALAQTEKEAAQTDGADRSRELEVALVAKASLEVSELRLELQRTRDELEQAREERGEVHVELEEVKEELEQAHEDLEQGRQWRNQCTTLANSSALPADCEAHEDETTGRIYYERSPVTWERPVCGSVTERSFAKILELNARVDTLKSELEEVREEAEINENRLRGERNEARERLEQSAAARVERRAPPLAPSTSAPASPVVKKTAGPAPRRKVLQDNVRR